MHDGGELLSFGLVGVHLENEAKLLEVVRAACAPGRFAGTGKGWQENSSQNADNRDHDQEFDQCKTFLTHNTYLLLVWF